MPPLTAKHVTQQAASAASRIWRFCVGICSGVYHLYLMGTIWEPYGNHMGTRWEPYGNHIKHDHFKWIKSPLNYQPFHQVLQPFPSSNHRDSPRASIFFSLVLVRSCLGVQALQPCAAPEEWKNPEECGKDMGIEKKWQFYCCK